MNNLKLKTLPGCMLPDGGPPCEAYTELVEQASKSIEASSIALAMVHKRCVHLEWALHHIASYHRDQVKGYQNAPTSLVIDTEGMVALHRGYAEAAEEALMSSAPAGQEAWSEAQYRAVRKAIESSAPAGEPDTGAKADASGPVGCRDNECRACDGSGQFDGYACLTCGGTGVGCGAGLAANECPGPRKAESTN